MIKYSAPTETPALPPERRALPGRPLPVPLRPDPQAQREGAVRSLVRTVLATGLNGLNPSVRPTDYALKTWPLERNARNQRAVLTLSRACSSFSAPRTRVHPTMGFAVADSFRDAGK